MADVRQILTILGMTCLLFFGIPIRVDNPKSDIKGKEKLSADTSENILLNTNEKFPSETPEHTLFLSYVNKFNKSYKHNISEYNRRFTAFKESLQMIEELNEGRTCNSSAYYGLTQFSDMDFGEFNKHHLKNDHEKVKKRVQMREKNNMNSNEGSNESSERLVTRLKRALLPEKFDWRDKGVLTPVYNQKLCGACWAFSTVETLETMNAINTGVLQKLSVQEAIDCSSSVNDGCSGGDICSLLQWMFAKQIKIEPALDYPLKWKTGVCLLKGPSYGVGITEYACNTYSKNEKLILDIIANHGPVAVAVNALTWQNYLGGVIQFHCDSSLDMLNHAVQIVGYDLTAEIPHYIVRNSWGESFGEKGYLKIAIGSNMCGLAHEVASIYV